MDIDNVLDKVDKETESIVETVDKVDGEKDKVEGQTEVKPDGKNGQESNNGGWITQLPKELREGIDPKYTSLAEYIQDLRANQKKDGEDSANEGDWESVIKEIDGDGYGDGEKAILKSITSKWKVWTETLILPKIYPGDRFIRIVLLNLPFARAAHFAHIQHDVL